MITKICRIARQDLRARVLWVRVEKRRDGSVPSVPGRFGDDYLRSSPRVQHHKLAKVWCALKPRNASEWVRNFDLKKSPVSYRKIPQSSLLVGHL
jgi:hypothetical protein